MIGAFDVKVSLCQKHERREIGREDAGENGKDGWNGSQEVSAGHLIQQSSRAHRNPITLRERMLAVFGGNAINS